MSKTSLLDELFEKDYASREIELSKTLPKIIIKTVSFEDQIALEEAIKELKGITNREFIQKYAFELLSRTIVSWGKEKRPSSEDWKDFLKSKPIALLDKLIKEQEALEKDVKKLLGIEHVEEQFFPEGEALGESKPSPGESTSDEKAV